MKKVVLFLVFLITGILYPGHEAGAFSLPPDTLHAIIHELPCQKGECLVQTVAYHPADQLKGMDFTRDSLFHRIDALYRIQAIEGIAREKGPGSKNTALADIYNIYRVVFQDKALEIHSVTRTLRSLPGVSGAEPNYIFTAAETLPDEYSDRQQLISAQWALDRIRAPEGWDLETGDSGVVIGILDSGVDGDHPDLAANIWKNPGEIPGNGIDDDLNGYIDDVHGWDFVSVSAGEVASGEDPGPRDNDPMDFDGHGTHVAGIAGAATNNGTGVAGVAWHCRIMPIRAGFKNPAGTVTLLYSDILSGTLYAVDNGASIINMSFGTTLAGIPSPGDEIMTFLYEAVQYAGQQGVLLVAAAGNEPIEGMNTYPAAFDEVLSVAATDPLDHKASFSSFNADWIDVAAPGVDMYSTFVNDSYRELSGTSMSSPLVAGLAGLIKSKHPSFTGSDLYSIITNEVDPPESEYFIGSGIVNVFKALQVESPTSTRATLTAPENFEYIINYSIDIKGTVVGNSYLLEVGTGMYPESWSEISSGTGNADGLLTRWDASELPNGIYTIRLSVQQDERIIRDRITIYLEKQAFPQLEGWPAATSEEVHSSAVVADLEQDGKREVIVYGSDGYLYVWNSDGTLKNGWPRYLGASRSDFYIGLQQNWLMGTPAVTDLNEDGMNEIIAGSLDGKIYALNYKGNPLPDFPVDLGGAIFSSPTVFDLDRDGEPEIICRSEGKLNVIHRSGEMQPGWPQNVSSGGLHIWSNQAIGDIDGDGDYEILVGSQSMDTYPRNNMVHAFHHNGQPVEGWPVDLHTSDTDLGWVLSSPAVGDLDGDGSNEVVIGCDDDRVWVLNGDGTNYSPAWPVNLPFEWRASPALADLDRDGDLEIVIGHRSNLNPNLRLYAFHHDGTLMEHWPYVDQSGSGGFTFGWISPVIGDIQGDLSQEVISIKEVGSFLGSGGGEIFALDSDAGIQEGFPVRLPDISYSSVTIADVDSDDDVELIVGGLSGKVNVFDLPSAYREENISWGQFRHDNQNTGYYGYHPRPVKPDAQSNTICEGSGVPYLLATGENIKWYADANLTRFLYAGNVFYPSDTVAGEYTYYATQTRQGFESLADTAHLFIAPVPDAPLLEDRHFCTGEELFLFAGGNTISWYPEGEFKEFTDPRNNRTYRTVTIGARVWMAENLDIGTRMEGAMEPSDNGIIEKYYYNDDPAAGSVFGGLYPWNELMGYETQTGSQGICPEGWHVPSHEEWKTLEMELGMNEEDAGLMGLRGTVEGLKMKQGGGSGFDALLGGKRKPDGTFVSLNDYGTFWTSDQYTRTLSSQFEQVYASHSDEAENSFSVRCVRDDSAYVVHGNKLDITAYTPGDYTVYVTRSQDGCESSPGKAEVMVRQTPSAPLVENAEACISADPVILEASGENITWYADIPEEPLTDSRDGRTYETVTIGRQRWMAENLDAGVRIDGEVNQTDNGMIEKYYYNNDPVMGEKYGGLYQWNELMNYQTMEGSRGICPAGWKVPSQQDWIQLERELGMSQAEAALYEWRGTDQGTQLKAGGSSGFNALMGGKRSPDGQFAAESSYATFWNSSGFNRTLQASGPNQTQVYNSRFDFYSNGFSLRCLLHDSLYASRGNALSVTEQHPGIYSWEVTQTVDGCESPAVTVSLTLKDPPGPPRVSDLEICEDEEIPGLVAEGESANWYGDSVLNDLLYSGNTYLPGVTGPGTYTYYVTQIQAGCESEPSGMHLTIQSLPPPPVVTDRSLCEGEPVPDLYAAGENITWFPDPDLSEIIYNGNSFPTGETQAGIYRFFVTRTTGECMSPIAAATLEIRAVPSPPEPENMTRCEGDTVPPLHIEGDSIRWYEDSDLVQFIQTGNSYRPEVLETGSFHYYVTQTREGCEGARAEVVLEINPIPVITLGRDTTLLEDEDLVLGPFPPEYGYSWNDGTEKPYLVIRGSDFTSGEHLISVEVNNGFCVFRDTILITVENTIGMNRNEAGDPVTIYPNPSKRFITVEFSTEMEPGTVIQVYDERGSLIRELTGEELFPEGTRITRIELNTPGLYYLRIINKDQVYLKKVIRL